MKSSKSLFEVGNRIEIVRKRKYEEIKYPSQILDKPGDNKYLISGPIQKGTLVPIYVGELIKIAYVKENKGTYIFKSKVIKGKHNGVYALEIERIGKVKRFQQRNFYRFNVNLPEILKKNA